MPYGNLLADVVQGSTANTPPVFKDGNSTEIGTLCRAWVNFNGTGTVAIRASFNVSSITDNGTGWYRVNFTNAMPDTNYAAIFDSGTGRNTTETDAFDETYAEVTIKDGAGGALDQLYVSCAIFR
jgi:hypothetical protein